MKQPFYFLLAFWGERYRNYFIDRCLPSLLAPNNLPILRAGDGHRFVIATTRADRRAIEHLPIFARLREYAEPTSHAHWFWDSRIGREWGIRASMILCAGIHSDARRLALFRRPIFWHAEDLDDVWKHKNAEVTAIIESALGDFFRAAKKGRPQRIISRNPRHWPVDVYAHHLRSPNKIWYAIVIFGYAKIIAKALAGNRHEMMLIYRSIGRRMMRLLGRVS